MIDFTGVGESIGHRTPEESWQERFDRITRQWRKLGEKARVWCNGGGHSMGPLRPGSTHDRVEHSRRMRCRHCHYFTWVKLTGEIQGVPTYQECKARR